MSVDELRRSFLFATEIENRLRGLRAERMRLLAANEGSLAIAVGEPCMIVHLVPLVSLTDPPGVEFEPHRAGVGPLGASGYNDMYSIDGLVTYSGPEERFETVRAFTTFFRSGIIEAVSTVHTGQFNSMKTIDLAGIEDRAAQFLRQGARELAHYGIGPPIYFILTVMGVRGLSANLGRQHFSIAFPHRADSVLLPELRLDAAQLAANPVDALKPVFNLLWNAFGQRGSPNLDTRLR